MPIYEYACKKYGEKFELRRSINDADTGLKCPGCGEKSVKRLLSLSGTTSTTRA